MGETKPLKLSTMLSIAYSDFRAAFREVRTSEGFLSIADLGRRPANPNKPKAAKTLVINIMTDKSAKQTQLAYRTYYHLLTEISTPIFRKFGWRRGASLSRIQATLAAESHPNERLARTLSAGSSRPGTGQLGRLVVGQWGQNRIKPKRVKTIVMREIIQNGGDQTHGGHPSMFQWVGAGQSPDFGKI